jgi:hypothetical protein
MDSWGVIPTTHGVMRVILVSSLLVNIMSCYLFYIRDTLFNVGDPIEIDFMSVWMSGPLSHRMSERYLRELIINLLHRRRIIITLIQSSNIECTM